MGKKLPFHYLYKLYDKGGNLLYVGESANPGSRIDSHLEKWWGVEIARIEFDQYENAESAKCAESAIIIEHSPQHNHALSRDVSKVKRAINDSKFLLMLPEIEKPVSLVDLISQVEGVDKPSTSELVTFSAKLKKAGWVSRKMSGGRMRWAPKSVMNFLYGEQQ